MDGLLIVDKPERMTSHDVVAAIRRLTGEKKVGHSGTLDPLATGVLVLCLGAATKALPYLPEGSKTYQVAAELGSATDTQDRTGRTIEEHQDCRILHEDLARALSGFLGPGRQVPPMYSAVQIDGERLYRLARQGQVIERPARRIEISALSLDWPTATERPVLGYGDRFGFTVTGSRGLYVRTLCHDLGQSLGCGAHLAELRRLASGPFLLADAVALGELTRELAASRLMSINQALAHLPAVNLNQGEAERVVHGNPVAAGSQPDAGVARAVDPTGRAIAVLERAGDYWQPKRVF